MNRAATVWSQSFRLAEYKTYVISDPSPKAWGPVALGAEKPEDHLQPLRNKFVYVYRAWAGDKLPTDLTRCVWELFVDGSGQISGLAADPKRSGLSGGFERDPTTRPATAPIGNDLKLETSIGGSPVTYFLFASRIRLDANGIKRLEDDTKAELPALDLTKTDLNTLAPLAGAVHVAALDPITIAENLASDYQRALKSLYDYLVPYDGHADPAGCTTRNKKKQLADTLRAILDSNANLHSTLARAFKDGNPVVVTGKEREMRAFITQFENDTKARKGEANARAAMLTRWLLGPLMADVLPPQWEFRAGPNFEKLADLLIIMAAVSDRLIESDAGRCYWAKVLLQPDHFVARHVFAVDTLNAAKDSDKIGAYQKAGAAMVALWEQGTLLAIRLNKVPSVVAGINDTLDALAKAAARAFQINVVLQRLPKKKFSSWAKDGTRIRGETRELRVIAAEAAKAEALRTRITLALEAVNFALAIVSLREASTFLDGYKGGLSMASAVLTSAKELLAWRGLKTVGGVSLRRLGGYAAAFDVIYSGVQATEAWAKADTTAAIGAGTSAVGSLILVGCFFFGLGGGTPISVIGAALVAVGTVLFVFGGDSDLETMVKHCFWGTNFGESPLAGVIDPPKWANGEFKDWAVPAPDGNFDKQHAALLNVVAAYTIKANNEDTVRIETGWVEAGSVFRLKVNCKSREGEFFGQHAFDYEIRCGPGEVVRVGAKEKDPPVSFKLSEVNGRQTWDIQFFDPKLKEFDPDTHPKLRNAGETTCAVTLDFLGDGESSVPASRAPLEFKLQVAGSTPNQKGVTSKDFA